jgi:hypothetical protein
MAILWLGFMSLFLMALGIPLVQRFVYAVGRGHIQAIIGGFAALLLAVLVFSGFLGMIGYFTFGIGGGVTLMLSGIAGSFILVAILGTFSSAREKGMMGSR